MKIRKKRKANSVTVESHDHYTKFKKVELAAMGSIVMCKATTVDGVEEVYDWNRQSKRDLVKSNCIPDVEIVVAPTVPKDKGWDYGRS